MGKFWQGKRSHADDSREDNARWQEPERIPESLARFVGLWVAVLDGDVIAAARNPRELAANLHEMGPGAAKAVARFVPEPSDVIVIGVG